MIRRMASWTTSSGRSSKRRPDAKSASAISVASVSSSCVTAMLATISNSIEYYKDDSGTCGSVRILDEPQRFEVVSRLRLERLATAQPVHEMGNRRVEAHLICGRIVD